MAGTLPALACAAVVALAAPSARAQLVGDRGRVFGSGLGTETLQGASPYGNLIPDDRTYVHACFDQFEGRLANGQYFRWDGQAWIGDDYNKLWLKTEGGHVGRSVAEQTWRLPLLLPRAARKREGGGKRCAGQASPYGATWLVHLPGSSRACLGVEALGYTARAAFPIRTANTCSPACLSIPVQPNWGQPAWEGQEVAPSARHHGAAWPQSTPG